MKKINFIFIIFIFLSFLVIINKNNNKLDSRVDLVKEKNSKEMRGVFISYMELNTYIQDKKEDESKENIKKIIDNVKDKKLNTIFLQVRSFDDAIYKSQYFPISKSILLDDGTYYDVLNYFIEESNKSKIDLYLWINPFRITMKNKEIDEESFAYKYKDSSVVKKIDAIYYYNPASTEVKGHIIDGIRELINNYKFKGLIFDDYFYPDTEIDHMEYLLYLKNNKELTKNEYHLMIINDLIESVYKEIKKLNKNILFGISPDGNIENNYHKNFADVKLWGSSNKYVDFLLPQLYYGFMNSTRPFYETLKEWNSIVTNKDIKLYYALALYKTGQIDNYAKEGINEWTLYDDIIKRQIILLRNAKNYHGFSLFRYDNLFNDQYYTKNTLKEIENLDEVLNDS